MSFRKIFAWLCVQGRIAESKEVSLRTINPGIMAPVLIALLGACINSSTQSDPPCKPKSGETTNPLGAAADQTARVSVDGATPVIISYVGDILASTDGGVSQMSGLTFTLGEKSLIVYVETHEPAVCAHGLKSNGPPNGSNSFIYNDGTESFAYSNEGACDITFDEVNGFSGATATRGFSTACKLFGQSTSHVIQISFAASGQTNAGVDAGPPCEALPATINNTLGAAAHNTARISFDGGQAAVWSYLGDELAPMDGGTSSMAGFIYRSISEILIVYVDADEPGVCKHAFQTTSLPVAGSGAFNSFSYSDGTQWFAYSEGGDCTLTFEDVAGVANATATRGFSSACTLYNNTGASRDLQISFSAGAASVDAGVLADAGSN
jgi:hypothetical protein